MPMPKRCCSQMAAVANPVINADDEFGLQLIAKSKSQTQTAILAYTLEAEVEIDAPTLRATQLRSTHAGTSFHLDSPYGSGTVKTK